MPNGIFPMLFRRWLMRCRAPVIFWLSGSVKMSTLASGFVISLSGKRSFASVVKKGKETEGIKFKDYFDFAEPLRRVPSHRLLALRRGETEGFLAVSIGPDEEAATERLERQFVADRTGTPVCKEQLVLAIRDGYKRLLKPSLETEFANTSKDKADAEAIRIFADNLRQLLLSPPLGQKRVLAIDPGYRTGCKTVCLDAQGNLLTETVLYLAHSESQRQQAISAVQKLGIAICY